MRAKPHHYTDEQIEFVRNNIKGTPYKTMWKIFNEQFGTNLKYSQMQGFLKRNNFTNGLSGQFEKGQKSWNKGMKGIDLAGVNGKKTQFRKGQVPSNYKPVGSERVDSKNGYVLIKVTDEGRYQDRWKLKHRIIWEQEYGKIPENHTVVLADGDKHNFDLENLILISRSQLSYLNKKGFINGDPDVLKAGLKIIDIERKVDDFEIKGGDPGGFEEYAKIAERNNIERGTFRARIRRGWSIKKAAYASLHTRSDN